MVNNILCIHCTIHLVKTTVPELIIYMLVMNPRTSEIMDRTKARTPPTPCVFIKDIEANVPVVACLLHHLGFYIDQRLGKRLVLPFHSKQRVIFLTRKNNDRKKLKTCLPPPPPVLLYVCISKYGVLTSLRYLAEK